MRGYSTDRELLGRQRERDTLDRLLSEVRGGRSRVLTLRGDAGIGKTALLDYLATQAGSDRVLRAAGVEFESDIAYAGLQQVCGPLLPHLGALPEVQQAALSTAFGLSAGSPPEVLLLGLAVLGLLSEAAAETPVVCLIDDAQWLDRMSALILGFVARRLEADSVAMVFAARTGQDWILDGLPELSVDGLPDSEARALLDSVLPGAIGTPVRERIVAETRGNPLALLELPRDLSSAELAFGFGGQSSASLAGRVEEGFRRRIAALPEDTRTLLLTAAVEPIGDVSLLLRALDRLGIDVSAAEPAVSEGLLELGPRVDFRHPLVRSASWRSAGAGLLREVHAALAGATDPAQDPDRHAWHRGHATLEPDEEVAAELAATADRASARGGRVAAAVFLERAATLTPDPHRRTARLLAAARSHLEAGGTTAVSGLLVAAEQGPLDPRQRADVDRLRARVSFTVSPGLESGPALLAAADQLAGLDDAAARETYLVAFGAALHSGRLGGAATLRQTAEAARAVPRGEDPAGLLLEGLIIWSLHGYPAAVPGLRKALAAVGADEDLELLWVAALVALELLDYATLDRLTSHGLRYARRTGARTILLSALSHRTAALLVTGRFAEAQSLVDESVAVAVATGRTSSPSARAVMTAHRGLEAAARQEIATTERDAGDLGLGHLLGVAGLATAVLNNGLGNFPAAMTAARSATEFPDLSLHLRSLSELVEAAARAGEPAVAARAREQLADRTAASATPWALGAQALADALAGPPEQAEKNFRLALEHFGAENLGFLQARTRLLYGEWLRRENRRVDAGTELRTAHEAFTSMGAEAFADRTARELAATGATVRRRSSGPSDELTPQETQIARLAMAHLTNPEIAAQMYLSPRTVEWHLRKIFTKLGITSRRELATVLK